METKGGSGEGGGEEKGTWVNPLFWPPPRAVNIRLDKPLDPKQLFKIDPFLSGCPIEVYVTAGGAGRRRVGIFFPPIIPPGEMLEYTTKELRLQQMLFGNQAGLGFLKEGDMGFYSRLGLGTEIFSDQFFNKASGKAPKSAGSLGEDLRKQFQDLLNRLEPAFKVVRDYLFENGYEKQVLELEEFACWNTSQVTGKKREEMIMVPFSLYGTAWYTFRGFIERHHDNRNTFWSSVLWTRAVNGEVSFVFPGIRVGIVHHHFQLGFFDGQVEHQSLDPEDEITCRNLIAFFSGVKAGAAWE